MTALLVAAHGDGDGSNSNALAVELGRRAANQAGFEEFGVAFQKGTPHFSRSLEVFQSRQVTVVPLMASGGYYCRTVLPRELSRNPGFSSFRITLTEPVGTHSGLPSLAAERVRDYLTISGLHPSELGLMVVGHGTRRHPDSRHSTVDLARRLEGALGPGKTAYAFLDEDPGPEQALASLGDMPVFVIPFLMGAGTHAGRDLPRRLGRREVFIDDPLGTLPGIDQLISHRARAQTPRGV